MKTKYIFLGIFTIVIIQFFSTPIFTYEDGAPAGRTNASGESTCTNSGCHASHDLNSGPGALSVELLKNGSPVSEYSSGEQYTIQIELTDQNMNGAGYQVTALNDSNSMAGSFEASGNNQVVMGNNREYLTHTSIATSFEGNTQVWELTWNAPNEEEGPVTFYSAGNAADNNGNQLGDYIYTTSTTINGSSTSISQDKIAENVFIYPNPVQSDIHLSLPEQTTNPFQGRLNNLNGQVVKNYGEVIGENGKEVQLGVPAGLESGVYILQLENTKTSISKKVLVQ